MTLMFAIFFFRWGILWRPLECSLQENTRIIMVCMKLHNYCIRSGSHASQRCNENGEMDGRGATPSVWFQNDLHLEDRAGTRRDRQLSELRQRLAACVCASGLRRAARSEFNAADSDSDSE